MTVQKGSEIIDAKVITNFLQEYGDEICKECPLYQLGKKDKEVVVPEEKWLRLQKLIKNYPCFSCKKVFDWFEELRKAVSDE